MERLLIVNADDFGLSKGQNYGIIEACRNGIVTSTTALVNGQAIDHAVQLSRDEPSLTIGMHFVLTMGKPLTAMLVVNPRWCAGKMDLAVGRRRCFTAGRNYSGACQSVFAFH